MNPTHYIQTPWGNFPVIEGPAPAPGTVNGPTGPIPVTAPPAAGATPFGVFSFSTAPAPALPAGVPGVASPFGVLGGGPGSFTVSFLQALAALEAQFNVKGQA